MGSWSLNEKVVLITGGARGIGAGTAAELARRGARPVLADLDIEGLARTAASISPRPLTLELDVTDDVACAAAVARALEVHGEIDAVWANAGIASFAPMELMDPAAGRRSIEVNLIGAYQTIHAALPAVLERRGYIAVTASLGSFAHGRTCRRTARRRPAWRRCATPCASRSPTAGSTSRRSTRAGSPPTCCARARAHGRLPHLPRHAPAAVCPQLPRRAHGEGHRARLRQATAADLHAPLRAARARPAAAARRRAWSSAMRMPSLRRWRARSSRSWPSAARGGPRSASGSRRSWRHRSGRSMLESVRGGVAVCPQAPKRVSVAFTDTSGRHHE